MIFHIENGQMVCAHGRPAQVSHSTPTYTVYVTKLGCCSGNTFAAIVVNEAK